MSEPPLLREIVSFTRRSTRMNEAQQRQWDANQHLRLDVPRQQRDTRPVEGTVIDFDAAFGRSAPLGIEIGSGTGDALVGLAAAHPELNVLAIEVHAPVLAQAMGKVAAAGLTNVRVMDLDARSAFETIIPPRVERVWTFFPDPWHKSRHHKRRLVNPEMAALVAARMPSGGHWHLATDWFEYARHMREVLDASDAFVNVHADAEGGWAPRLAARPLTKYEQRGLDHGREITDLTYRRV